MNNRNENDINVNHQQADNEELENQLENLTQTLQALNLQQRELRRRSDRVQASIRHIRNEQRRRSTTTNGATRVRRDHHNDKIEIGDYVNFLTRGRFSSRGGTITQVSHLRFVTARDSSGRLINREPVNVEIVRKHNENHDRRRRL